MNYFNLLDFPVLVPTKKPARRGDATKSHLTGTKTSTAGMAVP